MHKIPYLIAEVKTQSPFGYTADKTWEELFEVADTIGDMISIHTNSLWGGSFDLISEAIKRTRKPILAKGLHKNDADIERALEAGASSVLVVGRIPAPELQAFCMIEPTSLSQLETFISLAPAQQRYVWNSRDLSDGSSRDPAEFIAARKLCKGWLCQASNITSPSDILPGANAVLIGERLATFATLL